MDGRVGLEVFESQCTCGLVLFNERDASLRPWRDQRNAPSVRCPTRRFTRGGREPEAPPVEIELAPAPAGGYKRLLGCPLCA